MSQPATPSAEELSAFRAEVRSWLAGHLPENWGTPAFVPPSNEAEQARLLRDFQRAVYDAGWMGISWPAKYGGRGESILKQAIFNEERERVHAPFDLGLVSVGMIGPMLMQEASEEQRLRYLPPMLRGEEIWCQGFSEPGAGSDLASLRTRADRDGAEYVVNGQKIWTTRASVSDLMILLARTDRSAPKHRGIGAFIVPMDTPGLEVRPIPQISGERDFAEVFFDSVRLPESALIGGPTDGWRVAVSMLMFERFANTRVFEAQRLYRRLLGDTATASNVSASTEARLAEVFVDLVAARADYYEGVYARRETGTAGPAESVGKIVVSELIQHMMRLALDSLGPDASLAPVTPRVGTEPSWTHEFANARKHTIAAGTSEVLRDLVAERVLGLPRA